MPLDPTIILGGRAPQIQAPNALDLLTSVERVQDIRAQTEQRKLAGEAARQKAQDEAQIRSVMGAAPDVDTGIQQLYGVNPRAAASLAEQVGKARKETLDAAGKDLENQKNRLAHYHTIYAMVTDQASNDAIRPLFVKAFPELDAVLPTEYGDGSAVQRVKEAVISQKDKLDAKQKGLEFWAKGDVRNSLATFYSRVDPTAPDAAQQWDQIGTTARTMGAKPAEIALFGPYDPGAPARAATLGITPEKQAELDAQAATRAQTERHQTTQEGIAQGHLDVARAAETRLAAEKKAGARPVTSMDARRVGEFNSARDDLSVLADTVSTTGATGVTAQVGAALPNWVTDVTGWGTDAKKKQAVIDRVKQVIGKALESGVLRKEDEIKYTKILPTISDPPALVESKLIGVDAMIAQKRQDHLDALADAGYDVSKFTARATAPPLSERARGGAAAATAGRVRVVGPNGQTGTVPAGTPLPPGWSKQ